MLATAFDAAERKRLIEHGGAVLLIGGVCAIVAYAYSEFIAARTGRQINSSANATEAGFCCGGYALIFALLHLTVT